jgi:hypothetical protein
VPAFFCWHYVQCTTAMACKTPTTVCGASAALGGCKPGFAVCAAWRGLGAKANGICAAIWFCSAAPAVLLARPARWGRVTLYTTYYTFATYGVYLCKNWRLTRVCCTLPQLLGKCTRVPTAGGCTGQQHTYRRWHVGYTTHKVCRGYTIPSIHTRYVTYSIHNIWYVGYALPM